MNLIEGDCLVELKKLPNKSIDLFYLDLPYGQTCCKWDTKIDLKALWIELKRLAKNDRTPFFFSCTTKFGFELYNNAPKGWFRWDLVWKKNKASGFLNAYKLPMRKHEMIYCFAKKTPEYDVSSHLTGEEVEKTSSAKHKFITQALGEFDSFFIPHKSKVVKEPLPTTDITQPEEEHELIYCFARKTPEYDVSSHLTGEIVEKPSRENDKFLRQATGDGDWYLNPYKSKVVIEPLPNSDITQPEEEHELIYCFAKKTPIYDVSSHKEKETILFTNRTERAEDNHYNINEPKDSIKNTHKDRLPTSDITQPVEEHELIYCFARKSPEYDVSSHSEFQFNPDKGCKDKSTLYSKKQIRTNNSKTHKDRLPTSDITPSTWCVYTLDNKIDHRTSKPVKLMEFLLKYWTKEGDTVCDPTMGSGSMGVACKNMNRKFIGIELDEKIYELAQNRLK
jgi:uncharacterized HAD superfamily protein